MKKFKVRRKAQNHATGQPILRKSIALLVERARKKLIEGMRDFVDLGSWAHILSVTDIEDGERSYGISCEGTRCTAWKWSMLSSALMAFLDMDIQRIS